MVWTAWAGNNGGLEACKLKRPDCDSDHIAAVALPYGMTRKTSEDRISFYKRSLSYKNTAASVRKM